MSGLVNIELDENSAPEIARARMTARKIAFIPLKADEWEGNFALNILTDFSQLAEFCFFEKTRQFFNFVVFTLSDHKSRQIKIKKNKQRKLSQLLYYWLITSASLT